MEIIIALAAAIIFTLVFYLPLKRFPYVFYIAAIVIDIVYLSHVMLEFSPAIALILYPYMQRCIFAFALLTIVMFIGVFSESSKLKQKLVQIRGELSIFAALLAIGHIVNYLSSYIGRLVSNIGTVSTNLLLSFGVSVLLVILLSILTITSFKLVRKKMRTSNWKRLQKLAYVFFGLIYLHLILILVPSSSAINSKALISVIIYSVIMLVYFIARIRLALANKAKRALLEK